MNTIDQLHENYSLMKTRFPGIFATWRYRDLINGTKKTYLQIQANMDACSAIAVEQPLCELPEYNEGVLSLSDSGRVLIIGEQVALDERLYILRGHRPLPPLTGLSPINMMLKTFHAAEAIGANIQASVLAQARTLGIGYGHWAGKPAQVVNFIGATEDKPVEESILNSSKEIAEGEHPLQVLDKRLAQHEANASQTQPYPSGMLRYVVMLDHARRQLRLVIVHGLSAGQDISLVEGPGGFNNKAMYAVLDSLGVNTHNKHLRGIVEQQGIVIGIHTAFDGIQANISSFQLDGKNYVSKISLSMNGDVQATLQNFQLDSMPSERNGNIRIDFTDHLVTDGTFIVYDTRAIPTTTSRGGETVIIEQMEEIYENFENIMRNSEYANTEKAFLQYLRSHGLPDTKKVLLVGTRAIL